MKLYLSVAAVLFVFTAAANADCDAELKHSMSMTEQCLNVLDGMRVAAKADDSQKVAKLEAAIAQKDQEIARLKAQLATSEKGGLQSIVDDLKARLSHTVGKLEQAIQDRDEAEKRLKTALKERSDALASAAYWKGRAKLSDRYSELSNGEVIGENAYRVAAFYLNVRSGPTSTANQVAVLKHGDVVRIFDISRKRQTGGRDIFWLRTRKGWIYVTDVSDDEVYEELVDYWTMKQSDKPSRLAETPERVPAGGGARS